MGNDGGEKSAAAAFTLRVPRGLGLSFRWISGVFGGLIIAAEAMEFRPLGLQPNTRLLGEWNSVLYETPKAGAMVHFAHMGDFMGRDVIQNKWRRKDEPP